MKGAPCVEIGKQDSRIELHKSAKTSGRSSTIVC